ncbi:hypothetical protein [Defluviimonas salinarum]|uniref:Transposase n=1 Tax=Defluviimonas salinarum TaxID=2992147 RepID=A0ABT3J468_9RHOB|nr:hypothetical protein [Defluviimonas salinarum]MCW3782474.1 hypothetical protein [Defluviimonas salinarum]
MSHWLYGGLAAMGLPVICVETRHTKAFPQDQINKTDRNDARGNAQIMRVNLFLKKYMKNWRSQQRRALLTARKLLQGKAIVIENDIRSLLRTFGLKAGVIGEARFERWIRDLVEDRGHHEPFARRAGDAARGIARPHAYILDHARDDAVCHRLMSIPGAGPVTALAFTSSINVPAVFADRVASVLLEICPRVEATLRVEMVED